MAKEIEEARRPLPPYTSFQTITGFVERLKDTVVPNRIDSSLLRNYSGGVARQLVAALKFLGLVEEGGATTDRLRTLVKAYGTDGWKDALSEILFDAYQDVLGKLDLDTATPGQIDSAFRNYGAEGDVLRKCVSFWVGAITSAGVQISPHVLNRPRAKPERGARRAGKKAETKDENGEGEPINLPASQPGAARFSFPIPGKSAVSMLLPADLEIEDWEMVNTMVRAYIERKKKA